MNYYYSPEELLKISRILFVFAIVMFVLFFVWYSSRSSLLSKMKKGYARLKIGMTEAEVISLFGQPTNTSCKNSVTTLTWKTSEFRGALRGGYLTRKITVDFENAIVVGFDSENLERSVL